MQDNELYSQILGIRKLRRLGNSIYRDIWAATHWLDAGCDGLTIMGLNTVCTRHPLATSNNLPSRLALAPLSGCMHAKRL